MATKWSAQQKAIFEWFRSGVARVVSTVAAIVGGSSVEPAGSTLPVKNLVVRARAGTGKTTTILAAIDQAPESSILVCAFGKEIEQELSRRLRNPRAVAKTLHSVGFGVVRAAWRGVRVDAGRGFRLAGQAWAQVMRRPVDSAPDPVVAAVAKLAGFAKNAAPLVDDVSTLVDLSYRCGAVVEGAWAEDYPVERVAEMALVALEMAAERDGTCDFDDMVWLPVRHGWGRPTYDLVVVDEAQDMNAAQLALALAVTRGRMCVVGDDRQGIYAFRGADTGSIDRLKAELQAAELPLTVTYRCPQTVVAAAQALVPDYVAAPEAPVGSVSTIAESTMLAQVQPGDFILSRVNAPLGRICLALLREGRPARIKGRDIAKGLVALVRRQKASDLAVLISKLDAWRDRESAKVNPRLPSAQNRLDMIADQVDTIVALSDGLADVAELVARIEEMFTDSTPGAAVMLSSVHRAKGLESERVYVLQSTLYCNGKRVNDEERNIHYVAITRAKSQLFMVLPDDKMPKTGQGAAA